MKLVLLFLFWNLVTEDDLLGWIVWISIQILDLGKSVRNLESNCRHKKFWKMVRPFSFFSLGRVYLPSPE